MKYGFYLKSAINAVIEFLLFKMEIKHLNGKKSMFI